MIRRANQEAFCPDADSIRIHRHLLIRPAAVLGLRSSGNGNRVLVGWLAAWSWKPAAGRHPN